MGAAISARETKTNCEIKLAVRIAKHDIELDKFFGLFLGTHSLATIYVFLTAQRHIER